MTNMTYQYNKVYESTRESPASEALYEKERVEEQGFAWRVSATKECQVGSRKERDKGKEGMVI